MNADGTNQQQLTTGGGNPAWSPDGRTIAYRNTSIWAIDADGTNQRRLTADATGSPAWSPDGSKIAFNSWGDHLSVINADGSDQRQLSR